jgi:hypothetical protein
MIITSLILVDNNSKIIREYAFKLIEALLASWDKEDEKFIEIFNSTPKPKSTKKNESK